jgi:hypothetical protein
MTSFEERWADLTLRAFLDPSSGGLNASPSEVDYVECLRHMRASSTPAAALGLRVAVWLVAWAPFWLWGRVSTIAALDESQRTRLLRELVMHQSFVVRELMMLLKLTASIALLGVASVRARSGYDSHRRTPPRARLPLAS